MHELRTLPQWSISCHLRTARLAEQDNRTVVVISTNSDPIQPTTVQRKTGDGTSSSICCPASISLYNKFMGGVDFNDRLRQYNSIWMKGRDNYKYIRWFLVDVAVTNARNTPTLRFHQWKNFESTWQRGWSGTAVHRWIHQLRGSVSKASTPMRDREAFDLAVIFKVISACNKLSFQSAVHTTRVKCTKARAEWACNSNPYLNSNTCCIRWHVLCYCGWLECWAYSRRQMQQSNKTATWITCSYEPVWNVSVSFNSEHWRNTWISRSMVIPIQYWYTPWPNSREASCIAQWEAVNWWNGKMLCWWRWFFTVSKEHTVVC